MFAISGWGRHAAKAVQSGLEHVIYPPDEWIIETGRPPVKAWYTIQQMAYDRGLIKELFIGDCKAMCFRIWDVVSLYEYELTTDPFGLYGLAERQL